MITEDYKNFKIVTDDDNEEVKNYITLGNNILCVCDSVEQAKEKIDNKDWELLVNVASLVAYKTTEKYLTTEKEKEVKNEQ